MFSLSVTFSNNELAYRVYVLCISGAKHRRGRRQEHRHYKESKTDTGDKNIPTTENQKTGTGDKKDETSTLV